MKINLYLGGHNEPSTRFRFLQHFKFLTDNGIDIRAYFSRFGRYPPRNKLMRLPWAAGNLLDHLSQIVSTNSGNVNIIHREFLSSYYTLERLIKKPIIFDVDDAIFNFRNGKAAKKLSQKSDIVICGNNYLANWFFQFNKNIELLPTGIDTNKFFPIEMVKNNDQLIIGWSGSSSGYSYFKETGFLDAMGVIFKKHKNLKFRIISDRAPDFTFPIDAVEFLRWSPDIEGKVIQDIDIGVMPLNDSIFARGKCSYKMLTYMACSKPVIASPVGMNAEVLSLGEIGFGAKTCKEWVSALSILIEEKEMRQRLGKNGVNLIKKYYANNIIAPKLLNIIRTVN